MLISSSLLSTAAWHTEQVNLSANLATKLLPNTAHDAKRPAEQQNTERQTQTANDLSRRHASNGHDKRAASDKADREAAARAERHSEAQRRHARRAHKASADEAQRAGNESPNEKSAATTTQDTEASQFQAILGDVLPLDRQSGADGNPDDVHSGIAQLSENQKAASLPQIGLGTGLAGGMASANLNVTTPVAGKAGFADGASDAGAAGSADSAAGRTQTQFNGQMDASFEIKKEAAATETRTGQAQEPAEVAFAARIAERTATGTTLALHDAQATIAASRFDAATAGGQSGPHDHGAPNPGERNQAVQPDPSVETASGQPAASANDQLSQQRDAPRTASTQNGTARSVGTQTSTQPGGIASAPATQAAAASQNVISGMPVTAASSTTTLGSRSSDTAKSAGDDRAPQFLEAKNESTERPSESVRDISLKLTSQDQSSVQVRLSERAGELHVSVRTPDAGLTRGLREGLTDLVGRLEHSGYRTETWQPADHASTGQDQRRDSPSQRNSSQQQSSGGSGSDDRRQQNSRDHQEPEAQTPQWVGELESSPQRSNRSWLPSATR